MTRRMLSWVLLPFTLFFAAALIANADELVVTETGNVGIGTDSPTVKLHVSGGTDTTIADGGFFVAGSLTNDNISIDNNEIMARTNGAVSPLYLQHQGGATIMNAGGGNVGIGTAGASCKLTVSTNSSLDGLYLLNTPGWVKIMPCTLAQGSYNSLSRAGDNGIIFSAGSANTGSLVIGPWASTSAGIKIASNGNVGINKLPDTNYALDVNGVIRAGTWLSSSDARWKESIEPVDDALDRVCQLRGVSYEWIDKSRGEGRQLGVIAQEVEPVFPEVVRTDSQGFKSVEYSKLVAPLIEAVKELKAENERLAAENQSLRKASQGFEERLAKVESVLSKH